MTNHLGCNNSCTHRNDAPASDYAALSFQPHWMPPPVTVSITRSWGAANQCPLPISDKGNRA